MNALPVPRWFVFLEVGVAAYLILVVVALVFLLWPKRKVSKSVEAGGSCSPSLGAAQRRHSGASSGALPGKPELPPRSYPTWIPPEPGGAEMASRIEHEQREYWARPGAPSEKPGLPPSDEGFA